MYQVCVWVFFFIVSCRVTSSSIPYQSKPQYSIVLLVSVRAFIPALMASGVCTCFLVLGSWLTGLRLATIYSAKFHFAAYFLFGIWFSQYTLINFTILVFYNYFKMLVYIFCNLLIFFQANITFFRFVFRVPIFL